MSKFQWLLSNEDESVCKNIASLSQYVFPEELDNFVFTTLQRLLSHICLSVMCNNAS